MLDSLRSLAKSWAGKVLGAFLIVALAGFGISNVIFELGTTTVATVGGEEVSQRDFQRAYNTQLNSLAQQTGRLPTAEEAVAFGVPTIVLNRLASEAAINKLALDLGLGVSDDRLKRMVQQDPSFFGTLGSYDRDTAIRVLQQSGFTEAEYRELQTKAARRQQVISGFLANSPTPDAAIELAARYVGDTRTVDYFVLNAQGMAPVAEPTEAELAAYLAEHQAEFRTSETRTVDLLALTPEVIAATKTITDEEVAAEYERTKSSRVKIEKRTISQVGLRTPQQETWFELGKAAGKPLDQLLAETGLALEPIGTLAQTEITDPSLAAAAFELAQGDYVVLEGIGSKRVITVTAIEPGGQISLADSSESIRSGLALAAARNEYIDILDQIEELRAAFQPLEQIAERFGLAPTTLPVTATGAELAAVPAIAEGDRARVATAIFAAEQGDLAPTVTLSSNRNVWFDLKGIEPVRDQTLDEVRDEVAAAWTEEKTGEALLAEVEKVTASLAAGTPFADVAVSLNQFPQLSQPITRGGDGTPVLNSTVGNAIFNGGPGHFGSAVNADGDHVVFQVVDVTPADVATSADAESFIEESVRQSIYSDFVTGVKDAAGLRINRQALDQVLALDTMSP